MPPSNLHEQLTKYLTDAHSIEEQALVQMKLAPKIAGDEQIAAMFSDHLRETKDHERRVAQRLDALGASPAKLKDVAGLVTGVGFGVFAALQPDTPVKLVAHAFSYEHMEQAAYDLLALVAERADDTATAQVAHDIAAQEQAMGDRIAGNFDRAVQVSLDGVKPEDLQDKLNKYLADAHAIEAQSLQLLDRAPALAGASELAAAYEEHHAESEQQQRVIAGRLKARAASPSRLKDAALRLGALNWGGFFGAQPDSPAKLAAFAYAFEHLEIAAYELLARVASRAEDRETVELAERILPQERAAAGRIRSLFEEALAATLHERGLAAR
jgi:ferritin-like metal-binding protein YciE